MNESKLPQPRSISDLIGQLRGAAATANINATRLGYVNQMLSGRSTGHANSPEPEQKVQRPLLVELAETVDAVLLAVESLAPELAIAEQMAEVNQPVGHAETPPPLFGEMSPDAKAAFRRLTAEMADAPNWIRAPKPRAKKAPAKRRR